MSQGLYVFLFSNESDLDIYDNNKGREKVVVHPRGMSIKPGKFEKGFAVRVRDYKKHLHRVRPRRGPESALRECFMMGYLLDLSVLVGAVREPARIFERYWIEAVNAYLETNRLLADPPITQLHRAEWRHLEKERWTRAVQGRFRTYLADVSERVFEMARVGGLPGGSS